MIRLCWMILLLFVETACGVESETDTVAPSEPAAPVSEATDAPQPAPADLDLIGIWSGGRCAAREYRRNLEFRDSGTFTASDLVAPCPAGVQCIWSGIVVREGKWRSRGMMLIELLLDDPEPDRRALPLPGAVAFDAETGELYEATPGEPSPCRYRRTVTDRL